MSIRGLCIHSITVQENTGTQDGSMNTLEVWGDKYTSVAARIMPVDVNVETRWGGQPSIGSHKIFISDTSLTITEADRIVYGTRTFTILGGPRNVDEMDRMLVLDVREVR